MTIYLALGLCFGLSLPASASSPGRGASALARPARESTARQKDAAWRPLFDGRSLDGWYTFLQKHGKNSDPDKVITIEDGAIHLYKHVPQRSLVVMGYIATEKEYGDYHLRFQYRWGSKRFQ